MWIHVDAKKMSLHTLFLLFILKILPLSFGEARPVTAKLPPAPVPAIDRSNSTHSVQIKRSNATNHVPSEDVIVQGGNFTELPALNYSIGHIRRVKRDKNPGASSDLHVTHSPCDFDTSQVQLPKALTPHCFDVYNSRYNSERMYKKYQLYRLEGFMFGMYYERLKRYETEHHTFEYRWSGP